MLLQEAQLLRNLPVDSFALKTAWCSPAVLCWLLLGIPYFVQEASCSAACTAALYASSRGAGSQPCRGYLLACSRLSE